jgi:hypothetical protein
VYELKDRFRITHPFHPRSGQQFHLLGYRRSWGREVVDGQDAGGQIISIPLPWTDAAQDSDPFVVTAAGRSYFRPQDLLELATLIERIVP